MKISEYHRLLQSDLALFARESFGVLHPSGGFTPNWHIDYGAGRLMAALRGEVKRLIICQPPRSMKSILGSVALPAWALGRDPSLSIIAVSYSQELSTKLSHDCRTVMMSRMYRATFPNTHFSESRNSVNEFATTEHGSRLATSVGGVLTGRGADLIIVDDPLKAEEALSDVSRKRVNDWAGNTLLSRLNSKKDGVIILIMQRLHEDDLVGYWKTQGGWEVVSLAAIAEQDECYKIESILGSYQHVRAAGEALNPTREPLATLEVIRQNMGEYYFASQYQQRPAPMGGGIIKREWLNFYAPNQLPARFSQVIQSWDTANTPNELSDFSVCTTWGRHNNHFYLLHILRERMDYPMLKRKVIEQAQLFSPSTILMEEKSSGIFLVQELGTTLSGLRRYKPEGNKIFRMTQQSAKIENGFVHLPSTANWLANYIHELVTFPNGKYDDQIDSTSQALHWLTTDGEMPGIVQFYMSELGVSAA